MLAAKANLTISNIAQLTFVGADNTGHQVKLSLSLHYVFVPSRELAY